MIGGETEARAVRGEGLRRRAITVRGTRTGPKWTRKDQDGRVLKSWQTDDGWWITRIHWSDVPGYDYPAACRGLSPESIQQELEIDWSANPGKRVYKEFGIQHHVSVRPLVFDPHLPLYCGWDFGGVPAFVPTQVNAFNQWLIFPSVSPGENSSTGIYEFGQMVADHLLQQYVIPHGLESVRQLRLVHYGDPAGAARPPRTGDRPQETQSCFEILNKGLKLYQGFDEDGSQKIIRRPGWGWQIRPGAVNITDRLESVRGRLTLTLRDGLPAIVCDIRATAIIEGFGGGYCYPLRADGTYGPDPEKNWYCLPLSSRALTPSGWRAHDELAAGDPIYSYDPVSDRIVLDRVQAINRFEGPVPMTTLTSRTFEMTATGGHRCVVRRKIDLDRDVYETAIVTVDDLQESDLLVTHGSLSTCREVYLSDALVRLAAWTMGEGTYRPDGKAIILYQSALHNPAYVAELDELVRSFHGASRNAAEGPLIHWRVTRETAWLLRQLMPDKVPSYEMIGKMKPSQMRLFLYEMIRADGTWAHSKYGALPPPSKMSRERDFWVREGTPVLTQKNREHLERLQMMATLSGIPTRIYPDSVNDCWHMTFYRRTRNGQPVVSLKRSPSTEAAVWCPTTRHGTWIAEGDGRTFITGNSHSLDALGYIGTRLFHKPKEEEEEEYERFQPHFKSHASSRYG